MNTTNIIYTFLIAMLPIVELRGAIPFGVACQIPIWLVFLVSVVGNLLPIPFILIFIRKILVWMKTTKHFSKIALWIEKKAAKNTKKVMKYSALGLFLFVAIPLPGTGAWTGALVASLMNMRLKYSIPSIIAGVICAGVVISLISCGVLGALSFLL